MVHIRTLLKGTVPVTAFVPFFLRVYIFRKHLQIQKTHTNATTTTYSENNFVDFTSRTLQIFTARANRETNCKLQRHNGNVSRGALISDGPASIRLSSRYLNVCFCCLWLQEVSVLFYYDRLVDNKSAHSDSEKTTGWMRVHH